MKQHKSTATTAAKNNALLLLHYYVKQMINKNYFKKKIERTEIHSVVYFGIGQSQIFTNKLSLADFVIIYFTLFPTLLTSQQC